MFLEYFENFLEEEFPMSVLDSAELRNETVSRGFYISEKLNLFLRERFDSIWT